MTKSTITDERITSVIERLEHYACNLKWTNVRGAQDLLTAADGLRELQERRKAAMDSEPVVRPAPECEHQWRHGGANKLQNQKQCIKCGRVELDAQPAPVVPDAYVRDERGRMMLNGVCEPKIGFGAGWNACCAAKLQAGNSPVIPEGYVMLPKEMTDEIGEAIAMQANCCGGIALDIYDAMLAAAPQDTPALNPLQSVDSVADTWIPVSERMPEERMSVILWDAEIGEVTSGHYSHKTQTFYHCGDAIENEITHWMVVAAPQEVKGE